MTEAPRVVVLDVNETLSDMAPMADRWQSLGAPGHLAQQWFAEVLRDGFALTAAGSTAAFATIAAATARRLLAAVTHEDLETGVEHVMGGFDALDVHPDVPAGIRALHGGGIRLVTLSNGSAAVADRLLERTGLRRHVEQVLSVEDAPRWKPAPDAYAHAEQHCGVRAAEMMLVAVHPWDVDGAARAGLRTAWLNRAGAEYPDFFHPPELSVTSLPQLAEQLLVRRNTTGSPQ